MNEVLLLAITHIASLLIGALMGVVLDGFIKSPKLRVAGGGGGGGVGPGFYHNRIRVMNEYGFLGIRLGETTFLGKTIHRQIEKGIMFDRMPAYDCRALIRDKASGRKSRSPVVEDRP